MKLSSITHAIGNVTMALAAAFMFSACSSEDARVAPLKAEMEAAVKSAIPPFLSLDTLETEVIPVRENQVKINFKVKAKPSEDLFIVDRHLKGEHTLMILKPSQASGTEANLYGSMFAERTMDKWVILNPDIESGMAQLGSPRGSFDSRAMIDGSDEMKEFFADRDAERAELAKAEEEQQKKSEEARLALLEEKRLAEEANRKKLIEATAVGKRYRGILVESPGSNEVRQAVELQFTSQSGPLITAEIHNPDEPTHKQTFTGELVFVQQFDSHRSNDRHYPIILSPNRTSEFVTGKARIYFEECIIRLDLSNDGLQGEAYANRSNTKYGLRLQAAQ